MKEVNLVIAMKCKVGDIVDYDFRKWRVTKVENVKTCGNPLEPNQMLLRLKEVKT